MPFCPADRIEAVKREIHNTAMIRHSSLRMQEGSVYEDGLVMIDLLGEGSFGKVFRGAYGLTSL